MAHLRMVPLPGGEQAVREPWRVAVSHLLDAGAEVALVTVATRCRRTDSRANDCRGGINAPITSSAGRLFDAVAALAGIRDHVSFEGQAAMELRRLATEESTATLSDGDSTPGTDPSSSTGAL